MLKLGFVADTKKPNFISIWFILETKQRKLVQAETYEKKNQIAKKKLETPCVNNFNF